MAHIIFFSHPIKVKSRFNLAVMLLASPPSTYPSNQYHAGSEGVLFQCFIPTTTQLHRHHWFNHYLHVTVLMQSFTGFFISEEQRLRIDILFLTEGQ